MDPQLDTTFAVDLVWSWPVVVLVAAALVVFVLLTYPPRVRHLPKLVQRFLIATRLLAAAVLVMAMLRPEVRYTEHDRKSAVLFVAVDASRSMTTTDGEANTSRRATALKLLNDHQQRFAELSKLMEIRRYDFDSELHPVENFAEDAAGVMTSFGSSLDPLLKETSGKKAIGVLLLSDGASRAFPPYDADPRQVARRLGQKQLPILAVPIGSGSLSDAVFDYAVEDLVVSPVVFEKNTVPVQAKVRLVGAAGKPVTVKLLVEERHGGAVLAGQMVMPKPTQDSKSSTQIQASQNSETIRVDLSWVPDLPGEFKIAVQVVPADGELKTTNNQKENFVSVQRGGVKVAYFDSNREEAKFLRTVNQAQQIQLDYYWVRSGAFAKLTRIDASIFQPGRYDVFIIGDAPASTFGPKLLDELAKRVEEGAGLMMLGGAQSYGPGGYAETPLADLLPVAMAKNERQDGGGYPIDLHFDQDLQMLPTEAGLKHFVLRLASENNAELWRQLPPLRGANKLRLKNDFCQILARSPDNIPLLFALEVDRSRRLAFAGDSTFLWAVPVEKPFAEEHQRFWRQVILWLARKEDQSELPVWIRATPRALIPGAMLTAEFGARSDDGKPLPDADFKVRLTDPSGDVSELPAQRAGDQSFVRIDQATAAGTYRLNVVATRKGNIYGEATTRFLVESRDLELDNPAADPEFLKELSTLSGGRVIERGKLDEFLDDLLKHGPENLDDVRITRLTLWDNWGLLGVFVALMSAEWFVRKRKGLV